VDEGSLMKAAKRMTPGDAEALEETLASKPDDLELRSRLLAYYSDQLIFGDPRSPAATGYVHLGWLIEHCPAAPILGTPYGSTTYAMRAGTFPSAPTYDDLKGRWFDAVDAWPGDTTVLQNAAVFVTIKEPALAASLYERAAGVEPTAAGWWWRAGGAYKLQSRTDPAAALKALAAYERALALATSKERLEVLTALASTAAAAADWERARRYATEALEAVAGHESEWSYGDAVHHGHLAVGAAALAAGDVETAKRELLAAGATPGSPVLVSFGPNMALAKALLERGESAVVLEYFDECAVFWKHGRALAGWRNDVRAGRIPDFGANLVY
jgi:tetratricopeptide (TPR) repeat protein